MSAVLYVRPSVELKQALSASAEERGLNLNSTACALTEQGLNAGLDLAARRLHLLVADPLLEQRHRGSLPVEHQPTFDHVCCL